MKNMKNITPEEKKFECNCGYAKGIAHWHSPSCGIFSTPSIEKEKEKKHTDGICQACKPSQVVTQSKAEALATERQEIIKIIRKEFFECKECGMNVELDPIIYLISQRK